MSEHAYDSVAIVLDLMQEHFSSTFKAYYNGDPEAIPIINLPALIVDQTNDTTTKGAFAQDDIADTIIVKLVMNKRDDFDGDRVNALDTTAKRLRDLVAARDPKTGRYLPPTVKSVLRTKLMERVTAIAPEISVEYGINPRAGADNSHALLTAEAHVTFTITSSTDTSSDY